MSETLTKLIRKVRRLDDIDPRRQSWWRCDQCKGIVSCDEDGCCTACGRDARLIVGYDPSIVHELASAALPLVNEVDRLTAKVAEQAAEIERLTADAATTDEAAQRSVEVWSAKLATVEAKLRAVEALRDELLQHEMQHGAVTEGIIADKLTAILEAKP